MTQEEFNAVLEEHRKWLYLVGGKKADLSGADLHKLSLFGKNLRGACLRDADLHGVAFIGTDLRNADLGGANLREAEFMTVDLNKCNLAGADLSDAKFLNFPIACPEKGSFTAFKKCRFNLIVELRVPANAKRSSGTTRKCRCDKAKVVSITYLDGTKRNDEAISIYDPEFAYRVGETVSVDNFDDNRWNECAPGIHFFITRQDAINYF